MKTARSVLTATALGLLSFTFIASLTVGVTAPATQIAFGLLVIYGIIEIALVSYAPRRIFARSTNRRSTAARRAVPAGERASTVVEYPTYRKAA